MSPSIVFRLSCFAYIGGVLAYAFLYHGVQPFFLFLAILSASAIAVLVRKKQALYIPALLCVIFFFGMLGASAQNVVFEYGTHAHAKEFIPVSIWGIVSAEPTLTQSRQMLLIQVKNSEGDTHKEVPREIRVFTGFIPTYAYGDEVFVRCDLIRGNELPACVSAEIQRIARGKGNAIFSYLLQGKGIFLNAIQTNLSQPHASLLGALLVGERSGFPSWLTDTFIRSGILHIVAISGYNITIMIVSIYTVLRLFSLSRKQSFWCIAVGIVCFVLITGSSASVVRAAIMGIFVLCAQYIGRKSNAGNALLCAAILMIAWNPAIIFDVGFQLSFAATCGLVYISPILEQACKNISDAYGIKTIALQTISATLVTAPLLIFSFQRFSVIALVVNMLVLPLIPLVMAVGFFWTGFAFVGGMLAAIVPLPFDVLIHIASWPVWFLLSYIIIIAQWFAHISWASIEISLGVWNWVAVYSVYAIMIWCVWIHTVILKKRNIMIQCEYEKQNTHNFI